MPTIWWTRAAIFQLARRGNTVCAGRFNPLLYPHDLGRNVKNDPMIPHVVGTNIGRNIRIFHYQRERYRLLRYITKHQWWIYVLAVACICCGDISTVLECRTRYIHKRYREVFSCPLIHNTSYSLRNTPSIPYPSDTS